MVRLSENDGLSIRWHKPRELAKAHLWYALAYFIFALALAGYVHQVLHGTVGSWIAAFCIWSGTLAADMYVEGTPKFMARLFAKRLHVALMAFMIGLVVGVVCLLSMHWPLIRDWNDFFLVLQFSTMGFLAGVVIRMLLTAMIVRTIRRSDVAIQKLLLILPIPILAVLNPLGTGHKTLLGWYLIGIGSGFFVHFLARSKEHKSAKYARLREKLEVEVGIEGFEPTPLDTVAMDLLTRPSPRNRRKLRKLFRQKENEMSTVLVVVKASMYRMEGKYSEALSEIERERLNENRTKALDTVLDLHRALGKGETDLRKSMFEVLDEALASRTECLLARTTRALRRAEDIEIESIPNPPLSIESGNEAARDMNEALRLYEKKLPHNRVEVTTGMSVPVNWTFLLDAFGYVLLKTGHRHLSRSLLLQCAYEDPTFSSPFLHLAEWHMSGTGKPKPADRKLAELCAHICLYLEGTSKSGSLISRRARKLLATATKQNNS